MTITINDGVAFIHKSDNNRELLVFTKNHYRQNALLTHYNYKSEISCWKIDLLTIHHLIDDITGVIITYDNLIIIVSKSTIYVIGKYFNRIFSSWTHLNFEKSTIAKFYSYKIVDTDGKLWIISDIECRNDCMYIQAILVELSDDVKVIEAYEHNNILSSVGEMYKYNYIRKNVSTMTIFNTTYHRININIPNILSVRDYENQYSFLDNNARIYWNNPPIFNIVVVEIQDKIITQHCLAYNTLFFVADGELYYKKLGNPHEKIDLTANAEIIEINSFSEYRNDIYTDIISATMTDGSIFFIIIQSDKPLKITSVQTNYDFSTGPMRAVKSANKV